MIGDKKIYELYSILIGYTVPGFYWFAIIGKVRDIKANKFLSALTLRLEYEPI